MKFTPCNKRISKYIEAIPIANGSLRGSGTYSFHLESWNSWFNHECCTYLMSGSMVSAMFQSVKEVERYLIHCTSEWIASSIWSWWNLFFVFSIIDDGMSIKGHCNLKVEKILLSWTILTKEEKIMSHFAKFTVNNIFIDFRTDWKLATSQWCCL